ncbi:MAG: hypothetical protein LAO19_01505 [Acidobacteriia bacterium]|nr:hypothetical protein [Terriglobia bacterium]
MNLPYDVLQSFAAAEAISGREHRFNVGDIIVCEMRQRGISIVIEFETTFFLVDRSVFDACCKFRNEGGGAV